MTTLQDTIRKLQGPIAVFGAGGFIGANLMRAIFAVRQDCFGITHQRHLPWRLVDLPVENILRCDLTLPQDVDRLFAKHSFQTIFFLAAYGGYARQANAGLIYQTNVLGFLNVIERAAEKGFSALVHTGSSSEYGWNCEAPGEDSVMQPNSHYAISKVAASHMVQFASKKDSLPVINLRVYSVYGPWEEPDRLIPTLVEQGMAKKYPPFVDPEISRDYVYIDDAVEAIVLAAAQGVATAPGASLNIATGKPTTIRELAAVAKDVFGIEDAPQWSTMPNRSWDLRRWFGNPARAQEVLGWKARTSLKEGLEKTLAWTRAHAGLPKIEPTQGLGRPVRLSAVIACYKDNQAIPIMHERLAKVFQQLHVDYEIIFVNDASPDDTDDVLRQVCEKDEHVLAIEHSRNFGSQNAFLSGMSVSTGDAVILLDGDLQDPPEIIPEFFQRWKEGYEVVYGRRVKRETTLFTNLGYKFFYRLLRLMAYVPIPLDAGDFSMLDRRVVSELLAIPETDQFLRGLRAWVGFKQTSVDYIRPERMFGRTTNNLRKNIWWARKGLFSFTFVPLDLLLYGGIGLTVLSFAALILQIIFRLLRVQVLPGLTTIIVLILFFGGIQLLGLSILGEYLGKVLEESKRRPKFIRKALRVGHRRMIHGDELAAFLDSRKENLI